MPGGGAESPKEILIRTVTGCRNTQALYVVAKLGVADLLSKGPASSDELAEKLGVKSRPLFRVMRALAAQGVFTQDASDRFGLTQMGQLLRTDDPESVRYVAISVGEEYYRAAGELLYTVRTGETAFDHIYGKGHFEYMAENKEASRAFNMFMSQTSVRSKDPLEGYDFKGLIVDVGGGQGTTICGLLRSNPRLKGILFDLPQGLAGAHERLKAQGVQDRCQVVTGSFFESIPSGGDVYLLSRVLHDWPDEKAGVILANCRRAIRDDGALVLRESVIPEGPEPSVGKQVDLTMLFMLGGMERTEAEWRGLLRGAGFELTRLIKTGLPHDIMEARPV